MSKRKLYPSIFADRLFFWGIVVWWLFGWLVWASGYVNRATSLWYYWPIFQFVGPLMYAVLYRFQDLPKEDVKERYTVIIANIGSMEKQLNALAEFLKGERAKISESETTLQNLENEKARLEPVVMTQRETVNAILSAHAKTTALRARKERLLGFMSGVLTSLLASMIFEYLKHG
jgi:hypothetical protein